MQCGSSVLAFQPISRASSVIRRIRRLRIESTREICSGIVCRQHIKEAKHEATSKPASRGEDNVAGVKARWSSSKSRNYASMSRSPSTSSGSHTAETEHSQHNVAQTRLSPRPSSTSIQLPDRVALKQLLKSMRGLLEEATAVHSPGTRLLTLAIQDQPMEEEQAWLERLRVAAQMLNGERRRETRIAGPQSQTTHEVASELIRVHCITPCSASRLTGTRKSAVSRSPR